MNLLTKMLCPAKDKNTGFCFGKAYFQGKSAKGVRCIPDLCKYPKPVKSVFHVLPEYVPESSESEFVRVLSKLDSVDTGEIRMSKDGVKLLSDRAEILFDRLTEKQKIELKINKNGKTKKN